MWTPVRTHTSLSCSPRVTTGFHDRVSTISTSLVFAQTATSAPSQRARGQPRRTGAVAVERVSRQGGVRDLVDLGLRHRED